MAQQRSARLPNMSTRRAKISAHAAYTPYWKKLLEYLAFEAPDAAPSFLVIYQQYVVDKLAEVVDQDISRFIP